MTMGLPGSGKSFVLSQRFDVDSFVTIDPDEEKKKIEGFDPEHPELVHEQSQRMAEETFLRAIADHDDIIVDGTGTNVERMIRRTRQLQRFGYSVELVYVKVSLRTAIERNANRDRVVPENIIREKAETIATAFELVATEVDEVTVVRND